MGGGRYDGLVSQMGGPQVPAVGWAAGVERLAMLLDESPSPPDVAAVVPMGESEQDAALELMQMLRILGIRAEMAYRGNMKRRLERANRIKANFAIIIGPDEKERGVVQLKNLTTGEQQEVRQVELPSYLVPSMRKLISRVTLEVHREPIIDTSGSE